MEKLIALCDPGIAGMIVREGIYTVVTVIDNGSLVTGDTLSLICLRFLAHRSDWVCISSGAKSN